MLNIGIIESDEQFQKIYTGFFHTLGSYHILFVSADAGSYNNSHVKLHPLDVIIFSLYEPSDAEYILLLKKQFPNTRVIVSLASPGVSLSTTCLKNRADGLILKRDGLYDLQAAVAASLKGGIMISPFINKLLVESLFFEKTHSPAAAFTQKEEGVLSLVSQGLSYRQMAAKLGITTFTINHHLKKIYKKAGVNSRSQLLVFLQKNQADTT